jgi:hypothetical protein
MKRFGILATVLMLAVAGCSDDDNGSVTSPSNPTSTTTTFNVPISSANEVPAISNTEAGTNGVATIVIRANRDAAGAITSATADFQVIVNNLPSGSTLTAAHIHRAAAGVNGGIVVDTGMTSTTTTTINRTGINVAPDLAQQILTGPSGFYFNIHSSMNPGGVARGQLN